jgi:hypothetical protein
MPFLGGVNVSPVFGGPNPNHSNGTADLVTLLEVSIKLKNNQTALVKITENTNPAVDALNFTDIRG